MQKNNIILASSSRYRKQLLKKLPLNFTTANPDIDESRNHNETPKQLALRLALSKARALQCEYNQHLIIASDQVAMLDNQQLTKPGDFNKNIEQLKACSGHHVDFYTSICILDSASGQYYCDIDKTTVWFKKLSTAQITRYVDLDQAFDCAGGFKVESLGIALFDRIESQDPNALIGLPLIRLINLFHKFGVQVI